ncbi:MAG: 2-oxoacid:acceptor oxidoreductase subunit alpha [Coriobacteriia bacterium]
MTRRRERSGTEVRIAIGGPAGYGIKASGQTLSRAMAAAGLDTFDLTEYPSLIRGGHNYYHLRAGAGPLFSHVLDVDVLVALDEQTPALHADRLTKGAAVIFDPSVVDPASLPAGCRPVAVELESIAKQAGNPLMRNTAANGSVAAVVGLDLRFLEDAIRAQFKDKPVEVADANIETLRAGYEAALGSGVSLDRRLPFEEREARILIDGNSAVGIGALAAGIGLYAAYPMTPASSLLHFMAANEREHGVIVKHVEDELAAMNMVVGAAFTGARAMCGTSGGGFALMTEALGLAGVTESAVVVMVSQRPGPATGMPTWTEQADLRTVLHAGQGEFPRVVLAPGDHTDCFELTWRAFNLADALQTPVIILLDNYLSENRATVEPFDTDAVTVDRGDIIVDGEVSDYLRYKVTPSGISPRAVAGVKGALQVVNSYDHDAYGFATEDALTRRAQDEKRMRKEELARTLVPGPWTEGDDEADVHVVCWGSTKMPVREAASRLSAEGVRVRLLHARTVWPFPAQAITEFFAQARHCGAPVACVEGNQTGQFEGLIRQECLLAPDHHLRRYDGRPLDPDEVAAFLREVARDA